MGKTFRWKARYTVLSIISLGWIVAIIDRMAISIAMPYIGVDFHLSPLGMGAVMSAFFASYSLAQIPGGLLGDVFGIRKVVTIAMLWYSAFTAITGAVANLTQMVITRFIFGLGEGVFPACAFKSVAVWFPQKERATANALKLATTPLGAAISPLIVIAIMSHWGWRAVFYSLFLLGLLTALLFWIFVEDNPAESNRVSPEELIEIEQSGVVATESSVTKLGLLEILKEPNVLKYFFILLVYDIPYWGFTTWLPTYLVKARGFSMAQMGIASSLPFFAGTVGCILGGLLSDRYFSNNRKRPVIAVQLISALLLYLMFTVESTTILIICQTMVGFCIAFFTSAFWALPMNTVPKKLMGVASGFINMGGQIAAFIAPLSIGYLVDAKGGNFDLAFTFLIASVIVSCALVFTLPGKSREHQEKAINA
jgi:sugar phosphate permease